VSVTAVDRSRMAVELTRLNALRLGLDLRYRYRYCSLEIDLKNLDSGLRTVLWILIRIDLAVPNPYPYWECGSGIQKHGN
jgi:hypothetical protein